MFSARARPASSPISSNTLIAASSSALTFAWLLSGSVCRRTYASATAASAAARAAARLPASTASDSTPPPAPNRPPR